MYCVQLIRVIKLLGVDKSRGEEELDAHTVLDTIVETCPETCSKNNTRVW